jgi:hypothetical protein
MPFIFSKGKEKSQIEPDFYRVDSGYSVNDQKAAYGQ